jgi:PAS domain S-box-containing protein
MAWIGLVDEETQNVIPVMYAGHEAGYLSEMKKIKIPNVVDGGGPTGTAIREGKYIISNDIEHDLHMQPWKEAALERGYHSSIAVPVLKFGKVIGSFNVYAEEKDFFDAEEITLLQEASGDISFGLEIIDKENQRQQSERLLKEERDRFIKIAETSPGLVYSFRRSLMGASFSFPYAGKSIEDIYGYSKQVLEQDATIIVKHFHPEDSSRISESINESDKNLTPWKCEFRYNHPLKGEIWLEGHTIPQRENDGSTIWYGLIIDTTIRKKAEQEIENSNIRFELITRSTNDALWEWNFETGQLWGNETHQALYGLTMTDPVPGNEQWIQKIHPDDRFTIAETQTRSLSAEKNNFVSQYRFLNSNNEYRHIYDRCYILRNTMGEPVRMVGSMMDITEQQKAEALITEEKEFSDAIINSLPGIFYLIDENAQLLRWNKNFETVSGYSGTELSSINALDLFDSNEKELMAAAIQTAFKTGTTEVEANFYTKNHNKIPYYFNGFSFQFKNQKCIVGVGIDIYERKAAEEVIKQINKELHDLSEHLQTVREEERVQIARDVHDELGQQLTGLKLGIEWISLKINNEDIKLKEKMHEMIDLIKVTIQSVRRITANLRPSMLDDLDLVAALEWQSMEMKNRHSIDIAFHSNLTESNLSLETSTALFRIYQEALTNVVRHAAASKVQSSLELVDNNIILAISDNGIGMDLTVKKEHTSFGLIGIKERTFAIGGKFELISQPGKGTTVKIIVPV